MCEGCVHNEVCRHKKDYENVQDAVNQTISKIDNDGWIPFIIKPVSVYCNYYLSIEGRSIVTYR